MGDTIYGREETRTTATGVGSECECGCRNAKNALADRLHNLADTLQKKVTHQDPQSSMAQYGKQASELLDQSAEYIERFDYKEADARIRAYINESPGRSLMIAGAVGLVIGAIFRRR